MDTSTEEGSRSPNLTAGDEEGFKEGCGKGSQRDAAQDKAGKADGEVVVCLSK